MNKVLPIAENEFFELRFHSIGGQGAYTTGQMIASLGSALPELKASVFASYGSEKKGAPVSVFIRFLESENKITNFSAVQTPNIVCVFHEQLLASIDVLDGLKEGGTLVINSDLSGQELADRYNLNIENIVVVDGTKISVETGAKINTIMFGAIMKQLSFLDQDKGSNEIKSKLGYKYPELVDLNITAYNKGYVECSNFEVNAVKGKQSESLIELGYETQIEGGVILGANAHKVNRSISREGYLPAFDKEACINCTKCDTTCPDDCFVWIEQEGRRGRMEMVLSGIDYQYCKGCLRCVESCPTDALTTLIETRDYAISNSKQKEFNRTMED